MNILPKKRWHVRNKDNVAKVRRDEQRAKEEAEAEERRRELAEQEAKIDLLRRKLNKEKGDDSFESSSQTKHFNFFKEFEQESKAVVKSNKEYEKEKKAQQEDFEKRIGLLTYLGQSVSKDKGEGAWYLKRERNDTASKDCAVDQMDERKKIRLDPMQDMKKYLNEKFKSEDRDKHRKKKSKHREIVDQSEAVSRKPTIDELRAKRLKREKEEKRKADILLGKAPAKADTQKERQYDPTRYSSQFNPDLARQSKGKRDVRPY